MCAIQQITDFRELIKSDDKEMSVYLQREIFGKDSEGKSGGHMVPQHREALGQTLRDVSRPFGSVWVSDCGYDAVIARDPFGECPLHVMATSRRVWIANTIGKLREAAGTYYRYENVYAFPHGRWQRVIASDNRLDLPPTVPYIDYTREVSESEGEKKKYALESRMEIAAGICRQELQDRLARHPQKQVCILLSGGVDSFFVALLMRDLVPGLVACTIATHKDQEDVVRAAAFAKALGIQHKVYYLSREEIIESYSQVIAIAECYHLYNLFCAVGMTLLGNRLREDGFTAAFCGEGANEAVGDYRSWELTSSGTRPATCLQAIDSNFLMSREGRKRLVWGPESFSGRLNRQLGAGLAKHATSRMIKPFLKLGIQLECPYYNVDFMSRIIALDADTIHDIGGKSGLFRRMFGKELKSIEGIDELLDKSAKVRMQDGGRDDKNSITQILFRSGFDQRTALNQYNDMFGARIDVDSAEQRLRGM